MNKYENIISIIRNELTSVDENISECLNSGFDFLPVALENFLLKKSKKIRSAFAILFIKAKYGKISSKQIKVLSLAELIHNASLIHDDIIDEAEIRRNELTINSIFGNASAVIMGDYVLSITLKELLNFKCSKLNNLFINSMYELCKGELEQNTMKNKIPTIDEYIIKSRRKTAELFKTALIGALISENQNDILKIAEEFANNFGIMFQIKNDLTNFLQDKITVKSDIDNGIYTAPVIYLNENTVSPKTKSIKKNDPRFLHAVKKTNDLINLYGRKTLDLISYFPDNNYKNALINLCMEVQKSRDE